MNEALSEEQKRFLLELFEQETKKVYNIALRITRSPDWAEEAFQDTFLRIARWIRDSSMPLPEVTAVRGLVQVMAERAATDALRRHIRTSHREYSSEQQFASRTPDLDREIDVKSTLEHLSAKERFLVDLAREGYSSGEIARELGMSPVAVRVMKHRIVRKLQEFNEIGAVKAGHKEDVNDRM